jgi:hypothetical protein
MRANGEYEVVHLSVSNIGNEAQSVDVTAQKLQINGKQYDADLDASVDAMVPATSCHI